MSDTLRGSDEIDKPFISCKKLGPIASANPKAIITDTVYL